VYRICGNVGGVVARRKRHEGNPGESGEPGGVPVDGSLAPLYIHFHKPCEDRRGLVRVPLLLSRS
jgi:hypothetical protein